MKNFLEKRFEGFGKIIEEANEENVWENIGDLPVPDWETLGPFDDNDDEDYEEEEDNTNVNNKEEEE